jgi:hypothetical protein
MSEQNIVTPARSANPNSIFFPGPRPDFAGDYLVRFLPVRQTFSLFFPKWMRVSLGWGHHKTLRSAIDSISQAWPYRNREIGNRPYALKAFDK